MHLLSKVLLLVALIGAISTAGTSRAADPPVAWDPSRGILIAGATVVTMDDDHTVIPEGRVLVRDGRVVAVWAGRQPPPGVRVDDPSVIEAGPEHLLFPGLINLHNHPRFNHVHVWPAPSSHAIPADGKAGTDPYANRYQWGGAAKENAPPEHKRLVTNAAEILGDTKLGLDLKGEIVKYAEVAALLGGETSIQGAPDNPESNGVLVRNVDNDVFDRRIASPYLPSILKFNETNLVERMEDGKVDAWMVHLAEGVRGDAVSRAEFATLVEKNLLTDMTVIVHGTALTRGHFAAMQAAPTIRDDGVGDRRGAKLVWSPLSNLLLYGETTHVYEALAERVLVSLSTDWSPSGSRTLLRELKVADVTLRDVRLQGASRELIPELALAGKSPRERQRAEDRLDRVLVDMVTRNPALTLRWYDKVGSVEAGKVADLLLVRRAPQAPGRTVYRDLIDATEDDVELVLVGGEPLAGAPAVMRSLKPRDHEVLTSAGGRFQRAVDVTTTAIVPEGGETLAHLTTELLLGLAALGGDKAAAGGGPGPPTNTYSYLKANLDGGDHADLSDREFHFLLGEKVGFLPDGSLNLERVQLAPLFAADDDFLGHLLHGDFDPVTGLIADPTPPFALYPANLNHVGPLGNPFAGL